jgi:hypothetical protein
MRFRIGSRAYVSISTSTSTFDALVERSQLIWRLLTTDSVNAAIIAADLAQRRRRGAAAEEAQDNIEEDQEMRE